MGVCSRCKKETDRPMYCSKQCIKQAWYLRNTKSKSMLKGDKEFWDSETGIGYKWEKWIAEKIGAEHMQFNSSGCDLRLGKTLIDVKACNRWRRKLKRGVPVKTQQNGVWVFNRNKIKPCDWFYCICLVDGKPVKVLKIPAEEFGKSGITIGEKSKYDKYIVNL